SQQATRNRGKATVNSFAPIYDQEPATVTEDDEMSKEKKIDKLMALISLSIQCYNCKEYGHVSRECQKLKRPKDAAYHKEKMLLCKQEEARVQLNAEQADWKDDTDDESDDQELEAHYMYMAQIQEVTPDAADNSGPIFDVEPLHKVQNNNDNYNVFAIENEHPEQPESVHDIYMEEQGDTNITIDSLDMCYDREQDDQDDTDELDQERDLLASLIEKLKCEIDDSKNRNKFLETSNKALVDKLKDLKKFQAELDRYHDVNYASKVAIDCAKAKGDLIFVKPEFLKKAQRVNPRLYDIGCYNDNLALMLAPESGLAKESRSKLSDLIRPFDYDQLNNLYNLFVPQREKSPEQQYFSKESKMSHTSAKNENSKESFNKQTTLLEKRMDESIPWDQKCKSSKELFKIKRSVDTIFDGVERCKQTIAKRTYFGHIDPFIQNTIEGNFCPQIRRINADLEKFHLCLKEEMFLNEIDRLSREYYYVDHMNAILGVYTEMDEVTNLQCDYLEALEKCERVIPSTSVSRPQLKSNQMVDRVMPNNSQGRSKKSRQPIAMPISTREPKRTVNQSVATSHKKIAATDSTIKKPRNIIRKINEQVSKTCSWWYPKFTPPGYKWKPKSPTGNVNPNVSMPLGNASRTANILEPMTPRCSTLSNNPLSSNSFATHRDNSIHRTVKFRNDQIAPFLGYGDLVQGTITIKRVYYVEGLNHNLFSVGQFYDADLKVAFRKSTCYIRGLKGNDLLTGSRGTNLYSITL
ncbi:integrase, catalytic region, zinc finger, CCHC-type containing protein, partial [Tanacetum coccineum]